MAQGQALGQFPSLRATGARHCSSTILPETRCKATATSRSQTGYSRIGVDLPSRHQSSAPTAASSGVAPEAQPRARCLHPLLAPHEPQASGRLGHTPRQCPEDESPQIRDTREWQDVEGDEATFNRSDMPKAGRLGRVRRGRPQTLILHRLKPCNGAKRLGQARSAKLSGIRWRKSA